jgi:hypothetical protein
VAKGQLDQREDDQTFSMAQKLVPLELLNVLGLYFLHKFDTIYNIQQSYCSFGAKHICHQSSSLMFWKTKNPVTLRHQRSWPSRGPITQNGHILQTRHMNAIQVFLHSAIVCGQLD